MLRCQGQDTGQLPVSPAVHVRDRVPAEAVGPVGASKAGGAPCQPTGPAKGPADHCGEVATGGGSARRGARANPGAEARADPQASRAPDLPSGPKEKWLVKKERSRDRKRSGKDRRTRSRDRRRSSRGRSRSRRRRRKPSPCRGDRAESSHRKGRHASRSPARRDAGECQTAGCPRRRQPGNACCCHLCFESGGKRHSESCDGRWWAGTGSTNPPAPPGSGGGGGDDGKGGGPKKKKNRPSQKQRKRLAMQREAAGRGADGEARPPAEVKQEDPDYGEEELEELGGLARQVAVKASEAYARGTLASVQSRLRAWDAALRHLEKAGVVKRDPRPGFLTPVVLRKTVAYLCLRKYKSAALYGSAALGRHKKHYEVHPSLAWAARLAKRQCDKGAGPRRGRQPVVFPPPRLSVPLAPWERLLVTGVWHLLRADELASLRVGDVVFVTVEGRPTAALRVAKSKTDQAGHGTVVARACVCSGDRLPHCPACCLKEQWEARVGQLARARSVGSQEARLFLGDSGLPLTTAQISGLVEDYAAAQGLPVKTEDPVASTVPTPSRSRVPSSPFTQAWQRRW